MELDEVDAILAAARQPETTVPICTRGDLQADWEALDKELTDLRTKSTATLAGSSDPVEASLAVRIRALEEQMAGSTLHLRLRALTRTPWMDLIQAHGPREGNASDARAALNVTTFFPALIAASLVAPGLDEARLKTLLDVITPRQYDVLTDAAWRLNQQDVSVPFSRAASYIVTSSAETSKRLSGSASPTNGSAAGSRKKSPSTSGKTAG